MIRIKHIGLVALIALTATAIVGVTSASASGFQAEKHPASVKGVPSYGEFGFKTSIQYTCSKNSEFSSVLAAPSDLLTPSSMTGATCSNYAFGTATLETNGCKYIFNPGAETAAGEFDGTFDIGPPGCGPMVLNGETCDYRIPAQRELYAQYINKGKGSEATVEAKPYTSIAYTAEPEGGLCGAGQGGYFHGAWNVKAEAGGVLDGLQVSSKGAYLNEGGTLFEGEAFPISIGGNQSQSAKHLLTIQGRKLSCQTAHLAGALGAASASLPLNAEYDGCSMTILGTVFPASVKMNSCSYVLRTNGQLDVVCSKMGDALEVTVTSEGATICRYKVGAQEGLKEATLSNVGTGNRRGIKVDLALKAITYTVEKPGLLCGASGAGATYGGSSTLYGF